MRRTCRISKGVRPDKIPQVLPVIEKLGLTGSWRHGFASAVASFEHTFEENDPRIAELCSALKKAGLEEWLETHEVSYTDEELRAVPLIELSLNAGQREVVHEPAMFDLALGCPSCHTGSPQIAPMKIRPSALPKKALMCQTMEFEYLVTGPLYQTLLAAELTGLELMPVLSTKGDPLEWWQIVPRHVMPPMAPEQSGWGRYKPSLGFGTPCSVCKRDGYCVDDRREALQIAYRRNQLGDKPLPDVAQTWECQGVGSLEHGGAACGRVLISPRAFDIFRQFRIRGIQFNPVLIVED